MQLDEARLIPLQPLGAGRIARFDGVVCLVGDDPTRVATAALFDACRTHRGDGASLIRKIAGILSRAAGARLPPFAIVAQDDEALLLAVHGSVTVLAEQPGGPLRLGGGDVGTWATSRVLDAAYLSAVTAGGTLAAVPALIDLQRGVAVADSFVVLADGVSPGDVTSSDAVSDEPAAPTPAPAPAAVPSDAGTSDAPLPRILTPVAGDDAADELPPWMVPIGRDAKVPAPAEAAAAADADAPAPAAVPRSPVPTPEPPAGPTPERPAGPTPERPAGPPAGAPAPVAAAGQFGFASLSDGAFKIVELRPAAAPPPAPPLPTAEQQVSAPGAFEETGNVHVVHVHGLHCGRGHFNDPRARYCAVCGLAMFQNSAVLVDGVRPPLGVLLLNNGESYPLTRNLVIGREPLHHPEIVSGAADQLVPVSKGPSLSRVHAQIRLDGWDVHLVDEGSTNGTFVWDEARRQWIRLAPQQPYVLRPGDQLAFGELTATFETSLQQ